MKPLYHTGSLSTMSAALPLAVHYHQWVFDEIRSWLRGDVLEVGFGYGQYTRQIAKRARKVVAIDRDSNCVERALDMPINVELGVADVTSDDFIEKVGADSYDAVVCLNVLEHIEDDHDALVKFSKALRAGGKLVLLVPAHGFLYGTLDTFAGHWRRYDKGMMRRRFAACGLCEESLHYFNPIGGVGWWVNARLLKVRGLSTAAVNKQILLYDKYVQPLSKMANTFTKRIFGQSIVAVASKMTAVA